MWEIERIEVFPMYFLGGVDVSLWDIDPAGDRTCD
jgi:hypothetical protein